MLRLNSQKILATSALLCLSASLVVPSASPEEEKKPPQMDIVGLEKCSEHLFDTARKAALDGESQFEVLKSFYASSADGFIQSKWDAKNKIEQVSSKVFEQPDCNFAPVKRVYDFKASLSPEFNRSVLAGSVNPALTVQQRQKVSKKFVEYRRIAEQFEPVAQDLLRKWQSLDDDPVRGNVRLISDILKILEYVEVNGPPANYQAVNDGLGVNHLRLLSFSLPLADTPPPPIIEEYETELEQQMFPYLIRYSGELANTDCNDNDCKLYLQTLLFYHAFSDFWGITAQQNLRDGLIRIRAANAEYENFLFGGGGDGLYPWEMWVNSLAKSDDFFDLPSVKWNVVHPAPYLAYDNEAGSFEPSVMVEAVGFTIMNFESGGKKPSAPIGAAIAMDFSNDKTRIGLVAHLPLKRAVYSLGGPAKDFSKYVPCEACSFVFLTDGDDDWTFGVKLNVASLLYAPDKARNLLRKFN